MSSQPQPPPQNQPAVKEPQLNQPAVRKQPAQLSSAAPVPSPSKPVKNGDVQPGEFSIDYSYISFFTPNFVKHAYTNLVTVHLSVV